MSVSPLFTIITSTLNSGATLARCLRSVELQKGVHFEHLIADGASEDDTLSIVESFAQRYTLHLVCSEPDSGIYQAWNRAVDKARGQWILFLGSDDFLVSSDTLSRVAESLVVSSALQKLNFVYGDTLSPLERSCWGTYKPNRLIDCLRGVTEFPTSVFINSELFLKGHRFDESYRICADHKFFAQHHFYDCGTYLQIPIISFQEGGISSKPDLNRSHYRERLRLLAELSRPRPWYTEWYYWLRSYQWQLRRP